MADHPPTQQASVDLPRANNRRRLIAACAGGALVLIVACIFMFWPDTPHIVDAHSPLVSPDPAGIRLAFDRGNWTNAIVEVNGTFTCNVGNLRPGVHIVAWNRFQGPATALNQAVVRRITVRGEVDGKSRTYDCQVTVGNGFTAISHFEEN